MADFYLKVNDQNPSWSLLLEEQPGVPIVLAGGDTVTLRMAQIPGGAPLKGGACVITDGTKGAIRYDWASTDGNTLGTWFVDFRLVQAGKQRTVPPLGYLTVVVGQGA